MAFDAFLYYPGSDVSGETQDKTMKDNKALEILSFEIGAENNVNIGSITSGGGAGKATFKELTITKKTDTASCAMFNKLCEGNHFDDMVIELRRAGGTPGVSGKTFLKWEFKLVMIQDISWSGDLHQAGQAGQRRRRVQRRVEPRAQRSQPGCRIIFVVTQRLSNWCRPSLWGPVAREKFEFFRRTLCLQ